MSNQIPASKLALKLGAVSFSVEGAPEWCEKQLHAVLAATSGHVPETPDAPRSAPEQSVDSVMGDILADFAPRTPEGPSDFSLTLTNYLKARSASNRRLHRADGGMWRMPAATE